MCFAVVPNGLQQPIGLFQLRALEAEFNVAEWGFAMAPSFWSTGLFEEAATLVAEFAFAIGVKRIEARAVVENGRANRGARKDGREGEALLRKAFKHNEPQFLWAIVADEWSAPKTPPSTPFEAARIRAQIARAIAELPVAPRTIEHPWAPPPFPFFLTRLPWRPSRREIIRRGTTFYFSLFTFYFQIHLLRHRFALRCLALPHRDEHHREVLIRGGAVPVVRAAGNVRAVADAQLLDRLSLNLQPAAPGFAEHQLPGRVHVPCRIARARFEDAPAYCVAGGVEGRRIPREARAGPMTPRCGAAGSAVRRGRSGYVGERGAGSRATSVAGQTRRQARTQRKRQRASGCGSWGSPSGVLYFPNEQEAMC